MRPFSIVTTSSVYIGILCLVPVLAYESRSEVQLARGIVFHDANGNGKFDHGDKSLPNIKISNGRDITQTGTDGRYELPITDDTIVFVIKPRGWQTPLNENSVPQFYYIHKPQGSPRLQYEGVAPTGPLPDSINFPLRPQKEAEQFLHLRKVAPGATRGLAFCRRQVC